jgi:hypothetical protein
VVELAGAMHLSYLRIPSLGTGYRHHQVTDSHPIPVEFGVDFKSSDLPQ